MEAPRLARNHAIVYGVVREYGAGTHLTAAQVLAGAKRAAPRIGETTVYRALARLCSLGLLSEVRVPGSGSSYYELCAPEHAHLHCDRCGGVQDVSFVLPENALDEIARTHGAQISRAHITMRGTCSACTDLAASPAR